MDSLLGLLLDLGELVVDDVHEAAQVFEHVRENVFHPIIFDLLVLGHLAEQILNDFIRDKSVSQRQVLPVQLDLLWTNFVRVVMLAVLVS